MIRTLFEDARNIGIVEGNPFANMRLPAGEKKGTITAPTMDDYKALIDSTTVLKGGYGPEFKAMISFAAWTGIRQGELFALHWDDIDETEITISRARKVDGTIGKPKNGQTRTVPLLPPARVLEDIPRRPDPSSSTRPRADRC